MFKELKRLLGFAGPAAIRIPPNTGPVCTYCGGDKFYEGPSGGACVNILCANSECRHWFNHAPYLGMALEDLNRVEPAPGGGGGRG